MLAPAYARMTQIYQSAATEGPRPEDTPARAPVVSAPQAASVEGALEDLGLLDLVEKLKMTKEAVIAASLVEATEEAIEIEIAPAPLEELLGSAPEEAEEAPQVVAVAEWDAKMTKAQLIEIAHNLGVDLEAGWTKAQVLEALEDAAL